MAVTIQPITGIPEIQPGDDLPQVLENVIRRGGQSVVDGDVVAITHKVVSKAEGRVVELADDSVDAHRHLIDQEAVAILRRRGDLVIAETRHGFVCANAGVDTDRMRGRHGRSFSPSTPIRPPTGFDSA